MGTFDGQQYHQNLVHYLRRRIINTDLSGAYSLGWLPGNCGIVGSGVFVKTAWSGTGNEQVDLGFRESAEGMTTDPNAFTETALDIDAAVGHIAGDVVSAANLWFNEPAEVTATVVNTDSDTGDAWVYVMYIVDNS